MDVVDGEVVGGEVLLGHSQLGDQDVVAPLIKEYITGLELNRVNPLAPRLDPERMIIGGINSVAGSVLDPRFVGTHRDHQVWARVTDQCRYGT